jgi:hypothetical protein
VARALAVAMAAAILGASGAPAQAPADTYPEKPIKISVRFRLADRSTSWRA